MPRRKRDRRPPIKPDKLEGATPQNRFSCEGMGFGEGKHSSLSKK